MSKLLENIHPILVQTIGPSAIGVDANAQFPAEGIQALASAGLLGLISAPELGGKGKSLRDAAEIVEVIAQHCASTAMVLCMHYCAAVVIEKYGQEPVRRAIATGEHLSTLAFSEVGSRSHFWVPEGRASEDKTGGVRLDARKSWVTSAHHANTYVWSSQPQSAMGASSLWLVPRPSQGISIGDSFNGIGLRGNDSTPIRGEGIVLPLNHRLGPDGGGFDIMMQIVLPWFSSLVSACSLGIMEAAIQASANHLRQTRHGHLETSLSDLPTIRAYLARMRIGADSARTLWLDAISAIESERKDTMLRVLETKAAAAEASLNVTSMAMRVCGGAAYRKENGVERNFRDAQAATIMGPTTDVLYDFIGKLECEMPLF